MNSDFSCNATAGDSCMTIEKVDEMTRFADEQDKEFIPKRQYKASAKDPNTNFAKKEQQNDTGIWLAPWKDKAGATHGEGTLYANGHITQAQV